MSTRLAGPSSPSMPSRSPAGFPVFAPASLTFELHPEIAKRDDNAAHRSTRSFASVFAGTGREECLREREIDTITIAGYMIGKCVIGSAAAAEPTGIRRRGSGGCDRSHRYCELLRLRGGKQVHGTIMTVLNTNWAAVTTTAAWTEALRSENALAGDNLIESAARGRDAE